MSVKNANSPYLLTLPRIIGPIVSIIHNSMLPYFDIVIIWPTCHLQKDQPHPTYEYSLSYQNLSRTL
jgi:hypothetical protein